MRYFKTLLLMLVVAAVAVPAALAANAHFIGTPTCSVSNSGTLTCSGKAAGLGDGPVNAYLTADSIDATYVCRNHGGNIAPGQGTSSGTVTGPRQAIAPHNGQITFSPSLQPPATPTSSAAGCPSGKWSVDRTSLTYVNVVLHIDQGGVTDVLTYSFGNITG